MRCPFRIEEINDISKNKEVDGEKKTHEVRRQEFAECYGNECPFYEKEDKTYYEHCGRCEE